MLIHNMIITPPDTQMKSVMNEMFFSLSFFSCCRSCAIRWCCTPVLITIRMIIMLIVVWVNHSLTYYIFLTRIHPFFHSTLFWKCLQVRSSISRTDTHHMRGPRRNINMMITYGDGECCLIHLSLSLSLSSEKNQVKEPVDDWKIIRGEVTTPLRIEHERMDRWIYDFDKSVPIIIMRADWFTFPLLQESCSLLILML